MSGAIRLEYRSLPSVVPTYLKALLPGSRGLGRGAGIPRIEASLRRFRADPQRLQAYREVCGFPVSDRLPISFPHVAAFPLHLRILTHKAFPLTLMGLVHVRNSIHQRRALDVGEELHLNVHVEGQREVRNGIEFDLITRVFVGSGDPVWDSASTMLSRIRRNGSSGNGGQNKRGQIQPPHSGRYTSWRIPANVGRRYARVAGDINPIHLSPLSARLFGFPRAIAHGMWQVARCAAALGDSVPEAPLVYDVAFKLPLLLPSWVLMKYDETPSGIRLALLSADGEKPHLIGSFERDAPDTQTI